MKVIIIFLSFLNILTVLAYAQTFQISGTVKDENSEAILGAQVFISGTKKFTLTNDKGEFSLSQLNPGGYELVVNYMGFHPENRKVVLGIESQQINLVLKLKSTSLNEVVISSAPDPKRKKYVNDFEKAFLGQSDNSSKCRILNPEVIRFYYDEEKQILEAHTDEYLVIENKGLGYKVNCLLKNFELDFNTGIITYGGSIYFEELSASAFQKTNWPKNRKTAYMGSQMHFMRSLYKNSTTEEGFIIHSMRKIHDPLTLNEKTTIGEALKGGKGVHTYIVKNDSIICWVDKNTNKIIQILDKRPVQTKSLVKSVDENFKSINFKHSLFVFYKNEKVSRAYWETLPTYLFSVPGERYDGRFLKQGENYLLNIGVMLQCSEISIDSEDGIIIDQHGRILNPESLNIEKYWTWERIAEMLPLDYEPRLLATNAKDSSENKN